MKPGDKVFEFDYADQVIIESVCLDTLKYNSEIYVSVEYTLDNGAKIRGGGRRLGFEVFPTREALCEHYRKIFE